ncbi:carbohydrate ABC transporter permease [Paramicrobacterium chengjingii]|uniref:Carbohydrate ABC transporter permease n=1 Tax=Paramicrobacterium chengjingii TaxID=2769067 RepID=A0ABX6YG92_9MICO|nr:carbohydrate ABC transporter permease [Microbacterium chengjingii]QPZ37807.1 carbohydrate ABC transporter permease [Microbacterium chengjingii]
MTVTATRQMTAGDAPERRRHARGPRSMLMWIAEHTLLTALAVVFIAPVVFVFLTSLMSSDQTLTGALIPDPWRWENYVDAFTSTPLIRWFGNSALYAGLATIFMLLSSVPAAYVLAKIRIRYANAIFVAIIIAMLLPPQVTAVPVYIMWAQLDLTGTLWPLILPNLLGDAFSIFLLRQFFLTIPTEYIDAARMDGCNEWQVLARVAVPMAKPGIAAAGIFLFFKAWNDYFGPLLYASEDPSWWPVSYALATFRGTHGTDWGLTMALTMLVMVPVVIVFFFAQRTFVEGIRLSGVKG